MDGKKNNSYTIIDLFSGCGGMSSGFIKAGFFPVSAVEIDSEICLTYQKNHPSTVMFNKDISEINSSDLMVSRDFIDVIVGGPPCQGFSMAGKRIRNKGEFLDDQRNYLFKEFYRIVKDLLPSVFIMENVPGILSMNNGSVKETILELFHEIGYSTSVKVLLAADYGVPQLRRRAFFIGTNLKINPSLFFPEPTHGFEGNPYISVEDAIFDLPFINHGEGVEVSNYDKPPKSKYQMLMRKKTSKLFNHVAPKHSKNVINLLEMIKEGQRMADLPEKFRTKSIHSGAYGRLDRNKTSTTITTRFDTPPVGRVTHPILNRALTAREAARIQSFSDDFIFYGTKTSIGKQIGNAVPPMVSFAIAKKIKSHLDHIKK
jgi:DNA (cytosine-5)-methyltransferase 1